MFRVESDWHQIVSHILAYVLRNLRNKSLSSSLIKKSGEKSILTPPKQEKLDIFAKKEEQSNDPAPVTARVKRKWRIIESSEGENDTEMFA